VVYLAFGVFRDLQSLDLQACLLVEGPARLVEVHTAFLRPSGAQEGPWGMDKGLQAGGVFLPYLETPPSTAGSRQVYQNTHVLGA
jgi:hypothetical protein